MYVMAIANQKGGVGKTTTTVNVAAGMVKAGKRVLCLDLDPQGNMSSYLGYEPDGAATISELMVAEAAPTMLQGNAPELLAAIRHNAEGIDYIPSSILLASADVFMAGTMMREHVLARVLQQANLPDQYDVLLIDCLPSLGILLTNALAVADGLLIPVQAEKFALDGLAQLMMVCGSAKRALNPRLQILGILLTMAAQNRMSSAVHDLLAEEYSDLLLPVSISRTVSVSNSTNNQRSLVADAEHKSRGGRAGQEYLAVTSELLKRIEGVQ